MVLSLRLFEQGKKITLSNLHRCATVLAVQRWTLVMGSNDEP